MSGVEGFGAGFEVEAGFEGVRVEVVGRVEAVVFVGDLMILGSDFGAGFTTGFEAGFGVVLMETGVGFEVGFEESERGAGTARDFSVATFFSSSRVGRETGREISGSVAEARRPPMKSM